MDPTGQKSWWCTRAAVTSLCTFLLIISWIYGEKRVVEFTPRRHEQDISTALVLTKYILLSKIRCGMMKKICRQFQNWPGQGQWLSKCAVSTLSKTTQKIEQRNAHNQLGWPCYVGHVTMLRGDNLAMRLLNRWLIPRYGKNPDQK